MGRPRRTASENATRALRRRRAVAGSRNRARARTGGLGRWSSMRGRARGGPVAVAELRMRRRRSRTLGQRNGRHASRRVAGARGARPGRCHSFNAQRAAGNRRCPAGHGHGARREAAESRQGTKKTTSSPSPTLKTAAPAALRMASPEPQGIPRSRNVWWLAYLRRGGARARSTGRGGGRASEGRAGLAGLTF